MIVRCELPAAFCLPLSAFRLLLSAFCLLLSAFCFPAQAADPTIWGLFLDMGAPDGAKPLPPIQNDFNALKNHLQSFLNVPPEHVEIPPSGKMTREELQQQLDAFGKRVPKKALAFVYLRAYVTKPETEQALYFFPADGSLQSPAKRIRDKELEAWLKPIYHADVALLFDLWTTDQSLNVYFAARQMLGTASVNQIARASKPPKRTMAANLVRALGVSSDADSDRILRLDEVSTALQHIVYDDGNSPNDAVVAMTGIGDIELRTFPAAIHVETLPTGATVLVNSRAMGKSPFDLPNPAPGRYSVTVALPGHRTPEAKSVTVTSAKGKSYPLHFTLEPVQIRGVVIAPSGEDVGEITVFVAPDVGLTTQLAGPGAFAFKTVDAPLESGKEYKLIVATGDDRYFGVVPFKFSGHEDIAQTITLEERTLWEVAEIRFNAGYHDAALASAEAARREELQPASLSEDFARFLLEKWSPQTDNARAMISCAYISMGLNDVKGAHEFWTLARNAAPKGTPEYALAGQGMRSTGGDKMTYLIAGGLLVLVLASLVFAVQRHRTRQVKDSSDG